MATTLLTITLLVLTITMQWPQPTLLLTTIKRIEHTIRERAEPTAHRIDRNDQPQPINQEEETKTSKMVGQGNERGDTIGNCVRRMDRTHRCNAERNKTAPNTRRSAPTLSHHVQGDGNVRRLGNAGERDHIDREGGTFRYGFRTRWNR